MPAGHAYQAWRLTELARARLAAFGRHCDSCSEPAVIVTRREYGYRGERKFAERFLCEDHGQAAARRYRIEIKAAPSASDEAGGSL